MADVITSPADSLPLVTPPVEAGIFWRLRGAILATHARQAFQQARLRSGLIALLTVVFWAGMYFLFHEGFQIMRSMISHEGTRAETVHAIFNVFYLSLLGMITLSSAILLYSAIFRGREVAFLLTTPTSPERIVLFKSQETLLLSCWGFFLLGSPLLLAYGRVAQAPWYYYALMFPFMIAFAFVPVSLGSLLCLVAVRYFPRVRKPILVCGAAALIGLLAVGWLLLHDVDGERGMSIAWFQRMLARLQYSEQQWLPSWWLSTGLLEAAHPAAAAQQTSWVESLGFLAALTSTAMMLYLMLGNTARRMYVAGVNRLADYGSQRKRAAGGFFDRLIRLATRPFPRAMRLLLVKDIKVFRRDLLQWSQLAIFFGLLAFYFLNLRRLQYGGDVRSWMMVVGYLNVAVVGLLLATFTTRFIYPLISLEGRKFWILGTLPIQRSDIVWSKWLFACGVSVVPCTALILLSDVMLQLGRQSAVVLWMHQLTCAALCFGLAGIAVGLGARFPDFRESSPAKLASGFGGTVTLVLSVMFILVTVTCNAVTTCLWVSHTDGVIPDPIMAAGWGAFFQLGSFQSVLLSAAATVLLGLLGTVAPLWLGLRAFRRIEG